VWTPLAAGLLLVSTGLGAAVVVLALVVRDLARELVRRSASPASEPPSPAPAEEPPPSSGALPSVPRPIGFRAPLSP
jgi:hypothetical protein